MSTDEFAAPEPGTYSAPAGNAHRQRTGELDEAAERLDEQSLDDPHARGADFARGADPGGVRGFLDQQLRERPIPTLLAAVAAGWLVGKMLR
jgi:hypothetical protein